MPSRWAGESGAKEPGDDSKIGIDICRRHVNWHVKLQHDYDHAEQARRHTTRQYAVPSVEERRNTNDLHNELTWGLVSMAYGATLYNDVLFHVSASSYFIRRYTRDYLYHPDTLLLAS